MKTNNYATVKLSYSSKVKAKDRIKITRSQDVYDLAMTFWDMDTIELYESFYVLLLNNANQVLGVHHVASGTVNQCVVDVRMIMQSAILSNSVAIILLHNHPSGQLKPSGADATITNKIKDGAKLFDIKLHDHLIVSTEGYYSFADDSAI